MFKVNNKNQINVHGSYSVAFTVELEQVFVLTGTSSNKNTFQTH